MHRRNLLRNLGTFASLMGLMLVVATPGVLRAQNESKKPGNGLTSADENSEENKVETIVFGGGCFWCVEAVFLRVEGVSKVVSGYMGGEKPNPTYKEVSTGLTGYAEVVEVTFDPSVVTREQILVIFFKTHDPTTLNRQGADIGTQYRSVVFYASDEQKEATEAVIQKLTEDKVFKSPIVTEVAPIDVFYVAEDYHQNYFKLNPQNPYCQNVVASKVRKFEQLFKEYSVNHKKSTTRSKEPK